MASTQTDISASHPYTCNTCQVAYRNIDLQKAHMKSDWHRYNLKRRVASLPPISADVFTEKVLQARAATNAATDKAYFERACEACNKTYYSENAYQNHLSSQKHKAKELTVDSKNEEDGKSIISSTFSLGDPIPVSGGSVDSDAEDEFNDVVEGLQSTTLSEQHPSPVKRPANPQAFVGISSTSGEVDETSGRHSGTTTPVQQVPGDPKWTLQSCLFCNYESPTLMLNAHHMERSHGMYIPEKPYLVDLEGLVRHLQSKVGEGHECLYCGKVKATVFAVQTHMKDIGHCKIPFTSEDEQLDIGDYYDFRATYSDDEDEESRSSSPEQKGGARLGARRSVKILTSEGEGADGEDGEDDGQGWETDSSASSLDSEDLTAVPAEGHLHQFERLDRHRHHSHNDPSQRHQLDGWHSHGHKHTRAVFHDDYELHLPSGKSVGHRSLNRYYRQNLTHYPTPEERAERLAIGDADAMDIDDEPTTGRRVVTRSIRTNRSIVPRGTLGLSGVSEQQKENVKKAEHRGRTQKDAEDKRTDYMVGRKLNKQKNYYYRYVRGG